MMEIFISYIRKNLKLICFMGISTGIYLFVFYLYSVPSDAVGYAFWLTAFVVFAGMCVDFSRYAKKCRELKQMAENITFQLEELPETQEIQEKCYTAAIQTLYERKEQLESKMHIDRQEMTDYYTLWGHQIKVPIAAMRLLLQSEETDISVLSAELFKIEQYVEMVLSYLRMESISADMALHRYTIDEIVRPSVRKYSKLFILKKIKLSYQTIDNEVLTDKKWLEFVVEQILSNALKYTNEGTISIYMAEGKKDVLVIEDTGIGIWKEDLPRVFEKGFTGYNGRTERKSTGIGLYLCKTVMDKLNHHIYIESEVEKGTKVFLDLNREEFRKE